MTQWLSKGLINQYMRVAYMRMHDEFYVHMRGPKTKLFLFGRRKSFAYMNHPKEHSLIILELLRYGYNSNWFKSQKNWTYKKSNIFKQFGATCGGQHIPNMWLDGWHAKIERCGLPEMDPWIKALPGSVKLEMAGNENQQSPDAPKKIKQSEPIFQGKTSSCWFSGMRFFM